MGLKLLLLCLLLLGESREYIMQKHLDQRQNLKFLVAEGHTPVQCWRKLVRVYGEEETMSKPTV